MEELKEMIECHNQYNENQSNKDDDHSNNCSNPNVSHISLGKSLVVKHSNNSLDEHIFKDQSEIKISEEINS